MDKSLILNRVKYYNNFTTDIELANFLGINKSTLSNWYKRNTIDYDLVFSKCKLVDKNWLLTGDGETPIIKEGNIPAVYESKVTEKKIDNQEIPLYEISAAAGLKVLFQGGNQNIVDSLKLPNLSKVDGAMFVTGDSMYPLLKSGDIIAFKKVNNIDYLHYGNIYILAYEIDGDDYLVVKFVNKSEKEGHLKLVSYNDHYHSIDIPIANIMAIALVKATVRYNIML